MNEELCIKQFLKLIYLFDFFFSMTRSKLRFASVVFYFVVPLSQIKKAESTGIVLDS